MVVKKIIYVVLLLFAFAIMVYFYLINFDNMSETMLVNSVLYWYVPLVFGLYGITAQRIHKTVDQETNTSALKHLFSGKDVVLTVLAILIFLLSGVIGVILFFVPLIIFKPQSKSFDILVAAVGSLIWLVALFFFFQILWPLL